MGINNKPFYRFSHLVNSPETQILEVREGKKPAYFVVLRYFFSLSLSLISCAWVSWVVQGAPLGTFKLQLTNYKVPMNELIGIMCTRLHLSYAFAPISMLYVFVTSVNLRKRKECAYGERRSFTCLSSIGFFSFAAIWLKYYIFLLLLLISHLWLWFYFYTATHTHTSIYTFVSTHTAMHSSTDTHGIGHDGYLIILLCSIESKSNWISGWW